jgi:hypothetical protein
MQSLSELMVISQKISFKLIKRDRPDERKLGPKFAFNLWRIKHWDAIKKEVWILLHLKRIIWQ